MRSVNVSPMHDGPLDHTFVWVFWSRVNIYVECVILHAISSCLLPSSTVFHQNYFFLCSSATENRTTTILVETFLLPQSFPKSFPDPLEKKRIFTLLPTPTSKALTFTLEHT